jgi:nucleotide-binding universal stress UspA family protein
MKHILVVANRTLCEQHLLDEIYRHRRAGPVEFHVLVPALPAPGAWTWTEGEAIREAKERLAALLDTLTIAGIRATGEVGDASPVEAVDEVLRQRSFDEVVVSTLPRGLSRWLQGNVVRRIRARSGLPVTHVVAQRHPAGV